MTEGRDAGPSPTRGPRGLVEVLCVHTEKGAHEPQRQAPLQGPGLVIRPVKAGTSSQPGASP